MRDIILKSFKDLEKFIPRKIRDTEERFEGTWGDKPSFEIVLATNKEEIHRYKLPIRALEIPSVGLNFKVDNDIGLCELVLGITPTASGRIFADLKERETKNYNVAVVLLPRRRTMINSRGKEKEYLSSFGRLYGEGDNVGCQQLNFQSKDYRGSGLEPQLICATVNHGPAGTTDYWGFRFRASDLGNGNLTVLVQHLLLP